MTALPFQHQPAGPLAVTLRDYQQAAVEAIYDWFDRETGNPLVVVPTGGGKSLIIAGFVHSVLSSLPNERILILTHVRELVDQNYRALLRAWPGAPAGVYSAGLRRREHDARILFAGIQSVYDKVDKIGWADLVIVDEAHLLPRSGFGMYRSMLDGLLSMNSKLKVIGLTATPFRTGEGHLYDGGDRIFHGIAYDCDLVELIQRGYLSRVVSKGTAAAIDTSQLHVRMGEFVEAEASAAAMAGDNVPRACREIVARGQDRKAWLAFCCGVEHAEAVATELVALGITCATVFGDTAKEERDRVVAEFRAGRLRCIVNVNVLTTGFDAPQVDLIALLRPTFSPGLYVQMVGRGLRIAEGKTDCLVLDFGGNVVRHGPLDRVKVKPKGKASGEVMARECPECQTLVAIQSRICETCGFEFAVADDADVGSNHDAKPDEQSEVLSGVSNVNPIVRWTVHSTTYKRHGKPGKTPTLQVEHVGGFQERVREWVCFDHPTGSFPRRKAERWWRDRGGVAPPPASVDEAYLRAVELEELPRVLEVTVDTRGEWPELRGVKVEQRDAGLSEEPARSGVVPQMTDDLPF